MPISSQDSQSESKVQRLSRNRVHTISYCVETGDICIFKKFYLPLLCIIHRDTEDKRYKLYSLNDASGIRYIGITKQKLSYRLSGHIASCKQAFKNKKARHRRHCWIKSLLDKNLLPTIGLIAEFDTAEEAKRAEMSAIKSYTNLVNSTAGGDGIREYKFTQAYLETRRTKVDQYTKDGVLINTFDSISAAALSVKGKDGYDGKIAQATKGKRGRLTAFGYVWRIHGEAFDKYPVKPRINITDAQRKALSERQLSNNIMKDKKGLLNITSKPIIVLNNSSSILTITESVREVSVFTGLSRSCVSNMLKMNKEVKGYRLTYANKDIVRSLQKCKSSTLKAFVGQMYNLEVGY